MIKLTLKQTNTQIALNPKTFGAIFSVPEGTVITATGKEYLIKETYDEVIAIFEKYQYEQSCFFKEVFELIVDSKPN